MKDGYQKSGTCIGVRFDGELYIKKHRVVDGVKHIQC